MSKLTPKQDKFARVYVTVNSVAGACLACGIDTGRMKAGDDAYVYVLVKGSTDEIVYVGKGRDKRMHHHMRDYKNGHVKGIKKHAGIRKLIEGGDTVIPIMIFNGMSDGAALACEKGLINAIGRSNLLNSVDSHGHKYQGILEETLASKKMLHPSHKGNPIYHECIAEYDEVIDICIAELAKDGIHVSP